MEHRIILGGNEFLPFARSCVTKLKKLGLSHASQAYEVGGVSIKVRIEPGHEYIRISGASGVSRLAWFPEGFSITPRHAATAPDGWGLPETEDRRGTPGGPMRQVMINRHKNNNYPDYLYKLARAKARVKLSGGDPEGAVPQTLADKDKSQARDLYNWPLFYTMAESNKFLPEEELPADAPAPPKKLNDFRIGVFIPQQEEETKRMGYVMRQFKSRFVPELKEKKDEKWYCHRPEVMPYDLTDEEKAAGRPGWPSKLLWHVFQKTNEVRAAVGKAPLFPPLRGVTLSLAQLICREAKKAKVLRHDSRKYRAGYVSFIRRFYRAGLMGGGENIAITAPPASPTPTPADYDYPQAHATAIVDGWVSSPGHYANMIHDYDTALDREADTLIDLDPQIGLGCATLSLGAAGGGVAEETTYPVPEGEHPDVPGQECDPPLQGTYASQVFSSEGPARTTSLVTYTRFGPVSYEMYRLGGPHTYQPVTGDMGRLGPENPPGSAVFGLINIWQAGTVSFKGQKIFIWGVSPEDQLADDQLCSILGVAFVEAPKKGKDDTSDLKLRVMLLHHRFNSTADRRLEVVEGEVGDFPGTKVVLGSYALPDTVWSTSRASFSESGKAVVSYAVAGTNEGGFLSRWAPPEFWGGGWQFDHLDPVAPRSEELVFLTFEGATFTEVGRSHLDITPAFTDTSISLSCAGECNYLATYVGEDLRYMKLSVDSTASRKIDLVAVKTKIDLTAKLIFPDATELVITDTHTDHTLPRAEAVLRDGIFPTTGTTRHIMHLDIAKPERTLYMEYTLLSYQKPYSPDEGSTLGIVMNTKAEVKFRIEAPVTLLTIDNCTEEWHMSGEGTPQTYGDRAGGAPCLSPMRIGGGTTFGDDYGRRIYGRAHHSPIGGRIPTAAFKALLVNGPSLIPDGRGWGRVIDSIQTSGSVVGPCMYHSRNIGNRTNFQVVEYGDDVIVAGFIEYTFGRTKPAEGEGAFYYSTLDLETITGVAGMSKNILPIGVL